MFLTGSLFLRMNLVFRWKRAIKQEHLHNIICDSIYCITKIAVRHYENSRREILTDSNGAERISKRFSRAEKEWTVVPIKQNAGYHEQFVYNYCCRAAGEKINVILILVLQCLAFKYCTDITVYTVFTANFNA